MIKSEWDPDQSCTNFQKHQVSFDEAKSVFYDEFAVQFFDEHSSDEERFLMLGLSAGAKLLIVCHCEREHGQLHSHHLCSQQPSAKARFTKVAEHES